MKCLHEEFVTVVNEVGVDPNRLLEHPHTVALLQFVCGLGPRKATSLLKVHSFNKVTVNCVLSVADPKEAPPPLFLDQTEAKGPFLISVGTLRSNDATSTRTSLKKWIYVLSVYIAIIPTHLLCQMQANPPGGEFLGTTFKFRKRNKFRRCLFTYSIKREIRHFHIVVVQKRAKKCTNKRDARAKLLFCI